MTDAKRFGIGIVGATSPSTLALDGGGVGLTQAISTRWLADNWTTVAAGGTLPWSS